MSQHPSLKSGDKDKQHRSVLKRHERLSTLKEKEKWKEGDSVYGLAKVKIVRFKIKKEKAVPAEEAVEGAVAAAGTAAPAADAGKALAGKTSAAKTPAAKAPAGKEAAKPQAQGQGGKSEKQEKPK